MCSPKRENKLHSTMILKMRMRIVKLRVWWDNHFFVAKVNDMEAYCLSIQDQDATNRIHNTNDMIHTNDLINGMWQPNLSYTLMICSWQTSNQALLMLVPPNGTRMPRIMNCNTTILRYTQHVGTPTCKMVGCTQPHFHTSCHLTKEEYRDLLAHLQSWSWN